MEDQIIEPPRVASDGEIFHISGPHHLTTANWSDFKYQRSVAASLVQGVYVSERDSILNRQGSERQAPPWWEFFDFEREDTITDDHDSIIGAVYKLTTVTLDSPRHVIAFRGNILKLRPSTAYHDLKHDFHAILGRLHKKPRFKNAMQAVENKVSSPEDAQKIWLTGHSLGSAIALLTGKRMVEKGYNIETFLFNPPFFSDPHERLSNETVKRAIRLTVSFFIAVGASVIHGPTPSEQFRRLYSWTPHLFVNSNDPICSTYIDYFERRERGGRIQRFASRHSTVGLLSRAFGRADWEPLHFIPSAQMHTQEKKENTPKNKKRLLFKQKKESAENFMEAHGIRQWWDLGMKIISTTYPKKKDPWYKRCWNLI